MAEALKADPSKSLRVRAILHTAWHSRDSPPQGYELPASPRTSLMRVFQDHGVWRAKPPAGISAQHTTSTDLGLARQWSPCQTLSGIGGTPGPCPSHRWVQCCTQQAANLTLLSTEPAQPIGCPCHTVPGWHSAGKKDVDVTFLSCVVQRPSRWTSVGPLRWFLESARVGVLYRDDTKLCCAIQRKDRDLVLYPDPRKDSLKSVTEIQIDDCHNICHANTK